MKLTIEHLAPYLPYGLNIKILNYKCDYVGVEYSIANGYYFIEDSLHVTYEKGSTGKSVNDFKPILRPLSDMTKEFEVGDEIFVPFHAIKYLYPNTPNWNIYWRDWVIEKSHPLVDTHIEYCIMQLLFKYHFDVFGLVDQGLAIDINTLPPSQ